MQNWISVKDRLPEYNVSVLTTHKDSSVLIGWRASTNSRGENWKIGVDCKPNSITHWMPLPEPPKE